MTPIGNAVHLCVDMQRIFSRGGLWETPWMERVLPTVAAIAARCPERTVFTRFVTPASPEEAAGQWQAYFRRWKRATREMLDPGELELVPELVRYVPPAVVVDKPACSAFFRSPLVYAPQVRVRARAEACSRSVHILRSRSPNPEKPPPTQTSPAGG
jgi:nicotinamidase-related amidase